MKEKTPWQITANQVFLDTFLETKRLTWALMNSQYSHSTDTSTTQMTNTCIPWWRWMLLYLVHCRLLPGGNTTSFPGFSPFMHYYYFPRADVSAVISWVISRALIGSFLSSISVQTDKVLIYASFQQFNFQLSNCQHFNQWDFIDFFK